MYSIQQASVLAQVPASTIRYYEKIALIPSIKRNEQHHRIFDDQDIELLNLIRCFRTLGMSIEDIKNNIAMIHTTHETIDTQAILIEHKKKLEEQIHMLEGYIHEIDQKIVS